MSHKKLKYYARRALLKTQYFNIIFQTSLEGELRRTFNQLNGGWSLQNSRVFFLYDHNGNIKVQISYETFGTSPHIFMSADFYNKLRQQIDGIQAKYSGFFGATSFDGCILDGLGINYTYNSGAYIKTLPCIKKIQDFPVEKVNRSINELHSLCKR